MQQEETSSKEVVPREEGYTDFKIIGPNRTTRIIIFVTFWFYFKRTCWFKYLAHLLFFYLQVSFEIGFID